MDLLINTQKRIEFYIVMLITSYIACLLSTGMYSLTKLILQFMNVQEVLFYFVNGTLLWLAYFIVFVNNLAVRINEQNKINTDP